MRSHILNKRNQFDTNLMVQKKMLLAYYNNGEGDPFTSLYDIKRQCKATLSMNQLDTILADPLILNNYCWQHESIGLLPFQSPMDVAHRKGWAEMVSFLIQKANAPTAPSKFNRPL